MLKNICCFSGILAVIAVMLTGCQTESGSVSTKKVAKVVVKQAVKTAVRNSPVSIIKASK